MNKKTIIVIGGAGFIGSNLIRKILSSNEMDMICVDNFINSAPKNINTIKEKRFSVYKIDMSKKGDVSSFFKSVLLKKNITEIWHLAANSDIQLGAYDLSVDFKNTFLSTKNLLWALEKYEIKISKLLFSSSSAVYGYHEGKKLNEDSGPLLPISNYGAMKLASEALISAYHEKNKTVECYIFRFPNVVGMPATHGVLLDFFKKIYRTKNLDVLGNGKQLKQYLHVSDLVNAMLHIKAHSSEGINLYNIGNFDTGITVENIANIVVNLFNNPIEITYGVNDRGWIGDVPRFEYSTQKLRKLGWTPKHSSLEAIKIAAKEIYLSHLWQK